MNVLNWQPMLAEAQLRHDYSVLELDFPTSPAGRIAFVAGFALLFVYVVYLYIRDTENLHWGWRLWLTGLRLAAVAGLAVILLNPSLRTPEMLFRPSQVAVLVDTSLSMGYPETDQGMARDSASVRSRAEAVEQLLASSPLIEELNERHQVSVYTFDASYAGPHRVYPFERPDAATAGTAAETRTQDASGSVTGESVTGEEADMLSEASANASTDGDSVLEWSELLRPRGVETRLGDSLSALISKIRSRSLAGIAVISDGQSNAGFDPETAREAARRQGVRLISVGVGGTEPQMNLQVAGLQAPTDVHVGDAFDITALVQAQGLQGRSVIVELLARDEADSAPEASPDGAAPALPEPTLVESQQVQILEDGVPVEVTFQQTPTVAGSVEYFVRVRPEVPVKEWTEDDNERRKSINLSDRKERVLLIAGGPMRDYRFLRNMLYRHPGILVDVWLQTVDARSYATVSQESDVLLLEFPETARDLDAYDVIVAFDPDWSQIPSTGIEFLVDWISEHSGGLIVVAGDVYTPELAQADADPLQRVQELYPVFLSEVVLAGLNLEGSGTQPWPIQFTREGLDVGFLQLTDEPEVAENPWKEFEGLYRAYPTAGAKAGATVYANFADLSKQTEYGLPILMASQFYGAGRVFYLGTSEFWRLRSLSDEYYDRFWTKLIREVGQGRRKRGSSRGNLLLERTQYALGQTIRVQARLFDAQLNELEVDTVEIRVVTPSQGEVLPRPVLLPDRNRPGHYQGDFRANDVGTYRIELPVPDAAGADPGVPDPEDLLVEKVDVVLPNLEAEHPEQNVKLLKELVRDTGGRYLTLAEAETELPLLLPDRGEEIQVNDWLRTLWDRDWVLYALVGLLSAEWLTRKLLRLA